MYNSHAELLGYERKDGRKGIRNVILVAYLVECAHFVSTEIAQPYKKDGVQVVGFGGCYPNNHASKIMTQLCTHPNVGAVLLVSLGCESFNRTKLARDIEASGRPVETVVIQSCGGTAKSIEKGQSWLQSIISEMVKTKRVKIELKDLVIGTICGGSDATSGITANPAVGLTFDKLVKNQATAIFEETGEMIGCLEDIVARAKSKNLGTEIEHCLNKAARYYTIMGHGSFAQGNADGGLSTIEEKSLGAYSKSGSAEISGLIKPGDVPNFPGLYLLDVVPDGEPRFGFPNINDNMEITELIASGCHIILFTTGRGSVVGSAISPVIKICANPDTFRKMSADMDINAGKVMESKVTLQEVSEEIYDKIIETASGIPTASEELGHQEYVVSYKTFEPIGPNCLVR
ncbi:UxaA family hydrolase [Arenibacter sp. ARW7G5Y1]|uniref:UxaA family hydrolase n=1 Tax=Arenibacter sp. ARW7G5Y1 TaxID=2135619 RepID=UPI000D75A4F6|nr:UxaA family hydrolase [Arenibacter sp. ARW7G5Y1]PXX21845.1 altronate hydrolase [Arenibacter sp. ARW7G5Y1]